MAQAKQELIEQLEAKENELKLVRALQTKNQQLEQRIAELEKALENASVNNWGNTFSQQAAKVVNSDLEKTISPLMSEVDRLTTLLSQREQELSQLQTLNRKQQKESISDSIVAEFGAIGERFGWSGWSRRGYRAANGMLCTGVSAISAFISDLKASHPIYQHQEIAF
jgi:transcriptional regulator of heat shock response